MLQIDAQPPKDPQPGLLHDLRLRALLDLGVAGSKLLLQGAHQVVELLRWGFPMAPTTWLPIKKYTESFRDPIEWGIFL